MQKIIVIGSPGSGKSTFAIKLGKKLNLPVKHLDSHFWKPGWVETPETEWREIVTKLTTGDKWIIDGNYNRTYDIRFPAADTIFHLDFSRYVCMWRIFKRIIKGYGKVRHDLGEGCPEKIDFSFIKWVWNFRKRHRPTTLQFLNDYSQSKNIISFTNSSQIDNYLKRI
ncbi:MAG: DNA topology modulation protein [bacterium]